MSGSANWTVCNVPVKKKEVVIEVKEKIPYIKSDLTPLTDFIKETKMKYTDTPIKELGDAILHLEMANNLLI